MAFTSINQCDWRAQAQKFADDNCGLSDFDFIEKAFGDDSEDDDDLDYDLDYGWVPSGTPKPIQTAVVVEPEPGSQNLECPPDHPLFSCVLNPTKIIAACIDNEIFKDFVPGVLVAFNKHVDYTKNYIHNCVGQTDRQILNGLSVHIVNVFYRGEVCRVFSEGNACLQFLKEMPHYLVRTYESAPKLCNHGLRTNSFHPDIVHIPSRLKVLYKPVLTTKLSLDDPINLSDCAHEVDVSMALPQAGHKIMIVEEGHHETYIDVHDHPLAVARHTATSGVISKKEFVVAETALEMQTMVSEGYTNLAVKKDVLVDMPQCRVGVECGAAVFLGYDAKKGGWTQPAAPPVCLLTISPETDAKYGLTENPDALRKVVEYRAKFAGRENARALAGSRRLGRGRLPRLCGLDGTRRMHHTFNFPWVFYMLLHHMISISGNVKPRHNEGASCDCDVCLASARIHKLYKTKHNKDVYAEQFYRTIKGQTGNWGLVRQWLLENGGFYKCDGHMVVPVDTAGC